jgi:hypothetical protein
VRAHVERGPDDVSGHEWTASPPSEALLSAAIPGLGQVAQGRYVAAATQFVTVVGYMVSAVAVGGRRALLAALLWNVWSTIDAYRSEGN